MLLLDPVIWIRILNPNMLKCSSVFLLPSRLVLSTETRSIKDSVLLKLMCLQSPTGHTKFSIVCPALFVGTSKADAAAQYIAVAKENVTKYGLK